MNNPKSADIHLFQNRQGYWVARVTVTDPGEPYKLPPTRTHYTQPAPGRAHALARVDELLRWMETRDASAPNA